MAQKKHPGKQIINKLPDAEVGIAKSNTAPKICRSVGATDQTYFHGPLI